MRVVGFAFLFISVIILCILLSFSASAEVSLYNPLQIDNTIQENAFATLDSKCNECHKKKKPTYTFTRDNMDLFAGPINEQVFIKKKMPKGKKNKLTEKEAETLKTWLNSLGY